MFLFLWNQYLIWKIKIYKNFKFPFGDIVLDIYDFLNTFNNLILIY